MKIRLFKIDTFGHERQRREDCDLHNEMKYKRRKGRRTDRKDDDDDTRLDFQTSSGMVIFPLILFSLCLWKHGSWYQRLIRSVQEIFSWTSEINSDHDETTEKSESHQPQDYGLYLVMICHETIIKEKRGKSGGGQKNRRSGKTCCDVVFCSLLWYILWSPHLISSSLIIRQHKKTKEDK